MYLLHICAYLIKMHIKLLTCTYTWTNTHGHNFLLHDRNKKPNHVAKYQTDCTIPWWARHHHICQFLVLVQPFTLCASAETSKHLKIKSQKVLHVQKFLPLVNTFKITVNLCLILILKQQGGGWCFIPSQQLRLYHGIKTTKISYCFLHVYNQPKTKT